MSAPKAFPADRLGQLGLTKLEYAVIALVTGHAVSAFTDEEIIDVVDTAQKLLAECAKRELFS